MAESSPSFNYNELMQPLSLAIKLFTLSVWFVLAACVVFWVLKLSKAPEAPAHTTVTKTASSPNLDAARLAEILGEVSGAVAAQTSALYASRLVLHGTVATTFGSGVALISVDNAPPKPFRVGAKVIDEVRLAWVGKNNVLVGSERIYMAGSQPPASASPTPVPAVGQVPSPANSAASSPTIAPAAAVSAAPSASSLKPSLGTSVDPSSLPPEIAKAIADVHNDPNQLPPVTPGAGPGGQGKFEYPNLVKP